MKSTRKTKLLGLDVLHLVAPGKGLAQELQKNKEAILEILQAKPEDVETKKDSPLLAAA